MGISTAINKGFQEVENRNLEKCKENKRAYIYSLEKYIKFKEASIFSILQSLKFCSDLHRFTSRYSSENAKAIFTKSYTKWKQRRNSY